MFVKEVQSILCTLCWTITIWVHRVVAITWSHYRFNHAQILGDIGSLKWYLHNTTDIRENFALYAGLPDGIDFRPKIAIWENFERSFNWRRWYKLWLFAAILYIWWPFVIFCGNLVHCTKTNLAALVMCRIRHKMYIHMSRPKKCDWSYFFVGSRTTDCVNRPLRSLSEFSGWAMHVKCDSDGKFYYIASLHFRAARR
jgi:hypothetical protein